MGCGCGGSTPAPAAGRRGQSTQADAPRVGPGSPGFTWDGPARPPQPKTAEKK